MKYCVVKNATKVIDGSENPLEIMLQNALNAGFSESEVEILTKEEYKERKSQEPQPIPQPNEIEILQAKLNSATQQLDFQEELIVELAMKAYQ